MAEAIDHDMFPPLEFRHHDLVPEYDIVAGRVALSHPEPPLASSSPYIVRQSRQARNRALFCITGGEPGLHLRHLGLLRRRRPSASLRISGSVPYCNSTVASNRALMMRESCRERNRHPDCRNSRSSSPDASLRWRPDRLLTAGLDPLLSIVPMSIVPISAPYSSCPCPVVSALEGRLAPRVRAARQQLSSGRRKGRASAWRGGDAGSRAAAIHRGKVKRNSARRILGRALDLPMMARPISRRQQSVGSADHGRSPRPGPIS